MLQHGSTLVLRLSETLVARVVVDTDGLREGAAWYQRELDVVGHLARHGAPVIPTHPGMPPEPLTCRGYPVGFWTYVDVIAAAPEDAELGASLYACHHALASYDGSLERLAILHESQAVLEHGCRRGSFAVEHGRLLKRHLDEALVRLAGVSMQPLHGDAHPGNWLMTRAGGYWTDWEDVFSGPVEWDLASLVWNARWLENDLAKVERILAGYGAAGGTYCEERLEWCMVARAAVMCCWYPVLYPEPGVERRAKLQARLDWLACR